MLLATEMGILLLIRPYKSHKKVPNVKTEYIDNEIPDTSLVLMVFMAWGIKEMVVKQAAARPSRVIRLILIIYVLSARAMA